MNDQKALKKRFEHSITLGELKNKDESNPDVKDQRTTEIEEWRRFDELNEPAF